MYSKRLTSVSGAIVFCLLTSWQCGVNCDQSVSISESNEVNGVGVNGVSAKHQSSFVSSGPPSAAVSSPGGDEYRATYFYPHAHHGVGVNWNRDSYADAATEFGYQQPAPSHSHSHGHAHASAPGAVYAPAYAVSESEGYEDSGFGGGLGGIGGLGGLAGILGIKGIKGLGLLGLAKASLPILAILLPALLLLPLIFLFFPVPVITVPAGGQRTLMSGFNFGEISGKMTNLARSVLESDKCMERISCEMSRVSRGSFIDRTLKRVIPRFQSHMPPTLRRIARVFMEQPATTCNKKYACYLMDDSSPAKKST